MFCIIKNLNKELVYGVTVDKNVLGIEEFTIKPMIIITLSLSSFIKEMINSITSSDYYNFKNTSNLTNVFAKLIINESRFLFKPCRILIKTTTRFKTFAKAINYTRLKFTIYYI